MGKAKTSLSGQPAKKRAVRCVNFPCKTCAQNVYTGVLCGACRKTLDAERVALNLAELRELFRLTRKHWGSGKPRDLLYAPRGYRPCLIVKPTDRDRANRTPDEQKALVAECAERARLADLYDRAQATRGDARRAART